MTLTDFDNTQEEIKYNDRFGLTEEGEKLLKTCGRCGEETTDDYCKDCMDRARKMYGVFKKGIK
jgi:hypothetical protein